MIFIAFGIFYVMSKTELISSQQYELEGKMDDLELRIENMR